MEVKPVGGCPGLSFLLHSERRRSYAAAMWELEIQGRMQRGASVHSWPLKVTHLGFGFDPESWRII